MESDATAVPPEQALTDALLSLSWPLPRTVEDADAALARLEEVKTVLTRLEQQSVGTEAWWAGQVDALSTQSGFVLEWWRPVLRDPELDWTLNHQAHLTADLATLASAGARLLDQIEPRAAEEAEAVHARRAARERQERRWGPAAVPPFVPASGPSVPGARPQSPAEVFGDVAAAAAAAGLPLTASAAPSAMQSVGQPPGPAAPPAARQKRPSRQVSDAPPAKRPPRRPPAAAPEAPAPVRPAQPPAAPGPAPDAPSADFPVIPVVPVTPAVPAAPAVPPVADDLEPPQFPPLPPTGLPPAPQSADALNAAAARHRRPSYDFDDPDAPLPIAVPAAFPQPGIPPRGPGSAIVPAPRNPLPQGVYPPVPPGYAPPAGYDQDDEDDDEPRSLVPTGLRRHQRRLLMQTGAILVAIAVLCWWAVYTLQSSPAHPAAAGSTHPGQSTGQAGAGAPSPAKSSAPATSQSPAGPKSSPAPAPSTGASSGPDATTVSSVQVTLLGGSPAVPQIVALISVHTAGTGAVNVAAAYYGASGSGGEKAAASKHWTFSGQTSYQYSVPIANSSYCGTMFHFTLSAGGRSDAESTSPGC